MIYSGLVSITFRQLNPKEIVELSNKAGIQGIEWGGDIHVPHGNISRAQEVSHLTRESGLEVAAYGSYYKVGCTHPDFSFEQVLETAIHLKAPTIRVWAGNQGSLDADESWWDHVVQDADRIATLAEKAGVTISFEYHGGTLTDTRQSTLKLLNLINNKNIQCLWQPSVTQNVEERQLGLQEILPWLGNFHVYQWLVRDRLPLSDGYQEWQRYLSSVSQLQDNRYALLEFVKDDSPEQFIQDAIALQQIISKVNV